MTTFTHVKDSGTRQEFATGSRRDSPEGKGRFDLIPPMVLRRDALHLEHGAKKYGDNNWQKGQPLSRYYDSAMRHMLAAREGREDEDHLAAARWNLMGIMWTLEEVRAGRLPRELVDIPYFVGPTEPILLVNAPLSPEDLEKLNCEPGQVCAIPPDARVILPPPMRSCCHTREGETHFRWCAGNAG